MSICSFQFLEDDMSAGCRTPGQRCMSKALSRHSMGSSELNFEFVDGENVELDSMRRGGTSFSIEFVEESPADHHHTPEQDERPRLSPPNPTGQAINRFINAVHQSAFAPPSLPVFEKGSSKALSPKDFGQFVFPDVRAYSPRDEDSMYGTNVAVVHPHQLNLAPVPPLKSPPPVRADEEQETQAAQSPVSAVGCGGGNSFFDLFKKILGPSKKNHPPAPPLPKEEELRRVSPSPRETLTDPSVIVRELAAHEDRPRMTETIETLRSETPSLPQPAKVPVVRQKATMNLPPLSLPLEYPLRQGNSEFASPPSLDSDFEPPKKLEVGTKKRSLLEKLDESVDNDLLLGEEYVQDTDMKELTLGPIAAKEVVERHLFSPNAIPPPKRQSSPAPSPPPSPAPCSPPCPLPSPPPWPTADTTTDEKMPEVPAQHSKPKSAQERSQVSQNTQTNSFSRKKAWCPSVEKHKKVEMSAAEKRKWRVLEKHEEKVRKDLERLDIRLQRLQRKELVRNQRIERKPVCRCWTPLEEIDNHFTKLEELSENRKNVEVPLRPQRLFVEEHEEENRMSTLSEFAREAPMPDMSDLPLKHRYSRSASVSACSHASHSSMPSPIHEADEVIPVGAEALKQDSRFDAHDAIMKEGPPVADATTVDDALLQQFLEAPVDSAGSGIKILAETDAFSSVDGQGSGTVKKKEPLKQKGAEDLLLEGNAEVNGAVRGRGSPPFSRSCSSSEVIEENEEEAANSSGQSFPMAELKEGGGAKDTSCSELRADEEEAANSSEQSFPMAELKEGDGAKDTSCSELRADEEEAANSSGQSFPMVELKEGDGAKDTSCSELRADEEEAANSSGQSFPMVELKEGDGAKDTSCSELRADEEEAANSSGQSFPMVELKEGDGAKDTSHSGLIVEEERDKTPRDVRGSPSVLTGDQSSVSFEFISHDSMHLNEKVVNQNVTLQEISLCANAPTVLDKEDQLAPMLLELEITDSDAFRSTKNQTIEEEDSAEKGKNPAVLGPEAAALLPKLFENKPLRDEKEDRSLVVPAAPQRFDWSSNVSIRSRESSVNLVSQSFSGLREQELLKTIIELRSERNMLRDQVEIYRISSSASD